ESLSMPCPYAIGSFYPIGCRGTAIDRIFVIRKAFLCRAPTRLDLFVDDINPIGIGCRGTAIDRIFVTWKAFVCRAPTPLDLFVDLRKETGFLEILKNLEF
ncbi:hypothetical protein, partial [Microseira sp. BLCC-F43]|uniref:hypothetical protein n=1 Tax=Microseira sp. BLCC-F43 TaxID=3153602 RepID=UPI0035B8D76D